MDTLPPAAYSDFKSSSFRYSQKEPAKEKSKVENSKVDPVYETGRAILKLQYNPGLKEFSEFSDGEPVQLITQVITSFHQNAQKNIRTVYEYAGIVSCKHGESHPELQELTTLLFLLFDDLLFHFKMEEKILFPWILKRTNQLSFADKISEEGLIKQSITWRKQEHKKIIRHFTRIRVLTQDYKIPDDACDAYVFLYETMDRFEDDMTRLIHLEEDILFENALRNKPENH